MEIEKRPSQSIDISSKTLIKIVIILMGLGFLYTIRQVLGILFVSFVVAAALDPWVDKMQQRKIPRGIGILLLYLLSFGIVSFVVFLLIPPISEEIRALAQDFPRYYEEIVKNFLSAREATEKFGLSDEAEKSIRSLSQSLDRLTSGIFSTISSIFGGFVSFLGVLVITFYMTIEEDGLKKFLRAIAPVKFQPYVVQKLNTVQKKLSDWLKGQLLLSVIIGAISYLGLLILGVKYAIVLALVAGVTEFIPYVGPLLGAIPAVFLAFTQSPFKAILVAILYLVIQQLENQFIAPKVVQKSVGLNPIVTIVAMLIGARIAGLVGVILAVPAATILWVFVSDFMEGKRIRDNKLESDSEGAEQVAETDRSKHEDL